MEFPFPLLDLIYSPEIPGPGLDPFSKRPKLPVHSGGTGDDGMSFKKNKQNLPLKPLENSHPQKKLLRQNLL